MFIVFAQQHLSCKEEWTLLLHSPMRALSGMLWNMVTFTIWVTLQFFFCRPFKGGSWFPEPVSGCSYEIKIDWRLSWIIIRQPMWFGWGGYICSWWASRLMDVMLEVLLAQTWTITYWLWSRVFFISDASCNLLFNNKDLATVIHAPVSSQIDYCNTA